MEYLIDGNNLMGTILNIVKNRDEERKKVIDFVIKKLGKRKKVYVRIIFDGYPHKYITEGLTFGNVKVIFSKNITGDKKIIGILKKLPNREKVRVITSDIELQREVKRYGSNVISCSEFIKINPKREKEILPEKKVNPTSIDINFWINYFNKGGN